MKIKKKKGFTLIELLIVVAIIAILAAIAIPQFSSYRVKGYNAAASSDIRNGKTAEEALFADYQGYGNSATTWAVASVAGPVTITTTDTSNNSRSLTTGISNNVMFMAKTDVGGGGKGASYILTSKHLMGDRVFAADSDTTTLYWTQSGANTLLSATAPYALTPSNGVSDISGGSATAL
jgi:prepilin-type N-terminal cleavage/methylation domain-containing protein